MLKLDVKEYEFEQITERFFEYPTPFGKYCICNAQIAEQYNIYSPWKYEHIAISLNLEDAKEYVKSHFFTKIAQCIELKMNIERIVPIYEDAQ